MYSLFDGIGYINPSDPDIFLTDLTDNEISNISLLLPETVENLSIANSFPASFPVSGHISGSNKRLMINLVCKNRPLSPIQEYAPINVMFLVDTSSPYTYLSEKAMKALSGKSGSAIDIRIQSKMVIECWLSQKHFSNVNVLGMDFLSQNNLSLMMNFSDLTFELRQ